MSTTEYFVVGLFFGLATMFIYHRMYVHHLFSILNKLADELFQEREMHDVSRGDPLDD